MRLLQSTETVCVNAVILLVTMYATLKPYTLAEKHCDNNMTPYKRAVTVFVNGVKVYVNADIRHQCKITVQVYSDAVKESLKNM